MDQDIVAVKQFENFDYNFAKQQKALANQRLKYISFGFGIVILFSIGWAFFYSLNLFPTTSQTISQPIIDSQKNTNKELETQRQKTESYTNANIPYKDPAGRFDIDFLTPYVSNQIVITFNTNKDFTTTKQDADAIIAKAKQTVDISNVYYINNY